MLARKFLALLALVAITLAGCDTEEPPPPPPPLPSEGGIYGSLREALSPILGGTTINRDDRRQSLNRFSEALNENVADPTLYTPEEIQAYQDGRKNARRSIQKDIEDRTRAARDAEMWRICYAAILAFEVLQPSNDRYADLKDKSEKMMSMPVIVAKGGIRTGDDYARATLEITDPSNNQTSTENVREGQYFYDNRFRLLKIVGKDSAYEIEYCDVPDHIFTVEGIQR